ncbi:uncharacterized protein KIAA1614 homolog isoform X3 [Ahaetulla prasina]|uniref:uncharacterized protein KIAA1614 homolog isoform X3 n=1 Tax=Ahaetulla prasina TaxID=499056 RepID=UPI0026473A31|nr:uncharacterized protein KIAA1614 homolog isoform X3 [Ahaetulla prasina]
MAWMDLGAMSSQEEGLLPAGHETMEENFSTEKRIVSIKQCAKNTSRPKQPDKCSEHVNNFSLSGPTWIPVGQKESVSKSTSVLQSKVKALKEKRNLINKRTEAISQEEASLRKLKAWKGEPPTDPVLQNAVVEPQAQIRTYLTDMLLDSTEYPHQMQEEFQGTSLPDPYISDSETQSMVTGEPTGMSPPKEFRRLPGRNIPDKKNSLGSSTKKVPLSAISGTGSLKDLSFIPTSFEETNGREDHLIRPKEFDSNSMIKNDSSEVASVGRIWRTESWDSLGSSSSNVSTLSLAERVERNRTKLQEMLSTSQLNRSYLQEPHTLATNQKETQDLGPNNEIVPNDGTWDSNVSLQDSEGYRVFVPNQKLELSPRHEQAKQLLQRARMKARTNPLRASHNILLTASPDKRGTCRSSVADTKDFVLKNGNIHASGNQSDSSSGDSSYGQQRKQGPSSSRVRFEDESARDAEVRYMERLQQRQKRPLDSVLLSLGQGPLLSKPDLAGYINGDLQRKDKSINKPSWEHQSMGQGAKMHIHQSNGGCSEKGTPLQVNKESKCSTCGSYINNSADTRVNQTGNGKHEIANVLPGGSDTVHTNGNKELGASQENSRTKPLGPKRTPLWILPSRQRVFSECVRETYIGEVTSAEDVDSALGSTTDTSDSYRTDSEEAGISSLQFPIKNCHGVPRLLCSSEKKSNSVTRDGQWGNGSCKTSKEIIWGNIPNVSRLEIGSSTDEAQSCSLQGGSVVKDQETQAAVPRSKHLLNLCQMEKEDKDKAQTKVPGVQLREPVSPIYSQQLVFQDGIKVPMNRPVNHLCQTKQHTKQVATTNNLMNLIPAPPATGKVPSSPMSYRRAVLTGSHKLIKQDSGHITKTNELSVSAAYSDFQDAGVSGLEEHNGQQNPGTVSKHLALSSNNHNNVSTKPEAETIITGRDEQLQESEKMGKNQVGPSSSTCGVPPVVPNVISSTAINLSLTTEETNFTISTQSISREAPVADTQKIKPGQANIIQCKHLEVYPQPKKQQSIKKEVSSTSGLKKFFTTLSQSTKQRLGRFRCYSMEQISMLESGAAKPNMETGPDTICSPKMKKVPSLQSLQRVSPFCQPRKASSVQNLHSFLGKNNRSNVYLVGEPKDEEASSNRKTRTQHRRSLSVEDIGSPNLARTVGRVVAVFPDGTSQLELQRSQQCNFGFRVSSGNGRPDTGIYVQEMADTSTAKLYAGLLEVGDEILEINGAKVAGLGLARINELLLWAETLSLRVLKQRPVRQ